MPHHFGARTATSAACNPTSVRKPRTWPSVPLTDNLGITGRRLPHGL